MTEPSLDKFTLWVVPSRGIADELKQIMAIRKDAPHNSPTSYPDFEPHITLASVQSETPIPLSTIRNSIPTTQHAFQIKFMSVDVGDHYFRSVYITIKLDETLINLHRHVHETLKQSPRTPNFPHISLVYISDEDAANEERERYRRELEEKQLISVREGAGLRANSNSRWIEGDLVTEIWITKCVGPVETWEVVEKIPLSLA